MDTTLEIQKLQVELFALKMLHEELEMGEAKEAVTFHFSPFFLKKHHHFSPQNTMVHTTSSLKLQIAHLKHELAIMEQDDGRFDDRDEYSRKVMTSVIPRLNRYREKAGDTVLKAANHIAVVQLDEFKNVLPDSVNTISPSNPDDPKFWSDLILILFRLRDKPDDAMPFFFISGIDASLEMLAPAFKFITDVENTM